MKKLHLPRRPSDLPGITTSKPQTIRMNHVSGALVLTAPMVHCIALHLILTQIPQMVSALCEAMGSFVETGCWPQESEDRRLNDY